MSTRRSKGYHYATRRDGSKYRIYGKSSRGVSKRSAYPKKSYKRSRATAFSAARPSKRVTTYVKAMGRPAKVVRYPDGRVIIRHAEYITNVPSATGFSLATFPLNPGMSATFPWLSRIAQNFEEWVPKGIFFEFRTTSSDTLVTASTSPSLGQISMATQYNALDTNFQNNIQLLNYENASTTKPSRNLKHMVECKRSQTVMDEMYIRTGAIPPNADLRLYDLGKTSVSASGMQVQGSPMGQLWVSYEIELRKPRIPQDPIDDTATAHFQIPGTVTGRSFVKPFGDSGQIILPTTGSTMKNVRAVGSASNYGEIQFSEDEVGDYMVIFFGLATANTTTGTWTVTNGFGTGLLNSWNGNTQSSIANSVNNQIVRIGGCMIRNSAPNAVLRITWAADAGVASGSFDVYITRLPDGLN